MVTLKLFGLNIYNRDLNELIDILTKQKGLYVATPNVDHFVRIIKEKELFELYSQFSHLTNDSRVLQLLLKLVNLPCPKTICGSDLVEELFNNGTFNTRTLSIIGPKKEDVIKVCNRYSLPLQNLKYIDNPPMGFYDDFDYRTRLVNMIFESNSDFVLLCLGSPLQELLARDLLRQGCKSNVLCVGASIDYLSGRELRAPVLIQRLYLEWMFRFLQSPIKRYKRYFLNCPKIFFYILKNRYLSKY